MALGGGVGPATTTRSGDVEPIYVEAMIGNMSPARYVWTLNAQRRHLSVTQRAMIGAAMKEQFAADAKERMLAGRRTDPLETVPQGTARDQAGEAVGVSGKTIDFASKVRDEGTPELQEAVAADEIPVSTAAKLAELPPADQKAALEGGKEAVKAAVAPAPSTYPASDKFVHVLGELSGALEMIRQQYGSLPKMLEHDDWNPSESSIVVFWVKSFAHTFAQMERELACEGIQFPAGLDTSEVRAAVGVWLEYRKKIRKQYKDPADQISRLLRRFAKEHGCDPAIFVDAVDHSIAEGYTGCFSPKEKKNAKSKRSPIGPGQRHDPTAAARDPDHGKM